MINTYKKDKLNKLIVSILIIALTFSNWCILGKWTVSNAISSELELQTNETSQKNVKFDIGFEEKNTWTHGKIADINDIVNLKANISVENQGYLKDIYITFSGENDTSKNFEIIEINNQDTIKSSSANEIVLNQISKNQSINLEITAQWNKEIKKDISKLNQNNIVKFNATYVNGEGKEFKIEKNIILNIQWICENEITIESDILRYAQYEFPQEKGTIVTQKITINQNRPEGLAFKNIEINVEQIKIDEKLADEIIVKQENKSIPFEIIDNEKIKITDTNSGINLNTVEIYETYNEFGLEDIDSKENNKSDTEDDYSQTTALISISLGGVAVYNVSLLIIVLVAILAGIWYIKGNKILIKKAKKKYK